jgi:alkylated DNA repair protein alkB homolog 1
LSNLHGTQPDHWAGVVNHGDWKTFDTLRWSCLGYHYDWTKREYDRSNRTPFPDDLDVLANSISECVGVDLKGEAAIVNYYPLTSQMGAHVDDAELIMSKPIVSFTMGCSCVFLIGGKTKDVEPTALYITSGDAVMMSGEARSCFHAVPRIIPNSFDSILPCMTEAAIAQNAQAKLVLEYLQHHRINMNVRQVEGPTEEEQFATIPAATTVTT